MTAAPVPTPERAHGTPAAGLAPIVAAIGIVFGDIATSPLYTLQECLHGEHGVTARPENVLGCVSLIFWSLIVVVTLKYVALLMRADNQGEGGIMALLALVPRSLRERAPGSLGTVTVLVLVGAAFLFGDGVITPAISVLAAVEGLRLAAPSLEPAIVPITVVILIALFSIQSRGSGKLGTWFGPVMVLWLATALAAGLVQIAARPAVLAALWPGHGLHFLLREGFAGFRVLGGVVLSVTGGEALYADMGHFGRRPIRFAWLGFALPALVVNYFGQGALILRYPEAAAQPFYAMLPSGAASYPFVLLGTAATVIASQALITGVFSLVQQAMQLGYFPRLTVRHTSHEAKGQIYLPLMNWFLGVSCILLVLVFRESSRLAGAFGLAVSATMAATTLAFYLVAQVHFGWPRWLAGLVCAALFTVDAAFVGANALKFFDGGYIPTLIGLSFVLVMVCWARGRSLLRAQMERQAAPIEAFLADLDHTPHQRLAGVSVVMTANSETIPAVLMRALRQFRSLHQTVLLTTVASDEVPHVTGERATVTPLGKGLYRVLMRYGFMEEPEIHAQLERVAAGLDPASDPRTLVYLIGHERSVAGEGGRMGWLEEGFFALLLRNARNPSDYYGLPPSQVIELGTRIDL